MYLGLSRKSFSVTTWEVLILSNDQLCLKLVHTLPPGPDGGHDGLSADTTGLSSSAVRAEPGQQLIPDVLLYTHAAGMDLEDVGPPLQVWQAELQISLLLRVKTSVCPASCYWLRQQCHLAQCQLPGLFPSPESGTRPPHGAGYLAPVPGTREDTHIISGASSLSPDAQLKAFH